jgi:HPt (histidine-containing phosphotransfer) domain-containing protein
MATRFDEAELLGRVDNDVPFLAETVEMLQGDGRALMAGVRAALAAGDAAGVGRAGHALKGMISNFCAAAAQQAAMEVERLGKAADLAPVPAAAEELNRELEALIAELNAFVQSKSC